MTTNVIHRSDTEWPRWEVFKQDSPSRPHQAVGTVHATDAEHALYNARTVFARRPQAVSMWVAPAEAVLSLTKEALASPPAWLEQPDDAGERERYAVFLKTSHKQGMTFVDHVGEVEAASPQAAMKRALEQHPQALAWWVVPTSAIAKSPEDAPPSWFEPAKDKTYKQQSEYGMVGVHPSKRKGAKREPRA
jgi:ring-1,2-phenylacetyl-CoA epoxidase subunit PaaB